MRERSRQSGRHDEGATLVEFALVFPMMMVFVMGLITFGLIEAGDNTASSAAREGARVGILDYENAHQAGKPANDAIVEAAMRHLGSGLVRNSSVTVTCVRADVDGDIVPIEGSGTCAKGAVVPGQDMVEVRIEWDSVAPVETPRRSEFARMAIIGRPDLGAGSLTPPDEGDPENPDDVQVEEEPEPPPTCAIVGITVDPNPIAVNVQGNNNGSLAENVVYRAETNGAVDCGEVAFAWPSNTTHGTTIAPNPKPGDHAYIGSLVKGSGTGWSVTRIDQELVVTAANGETDSIIVNAVPHNS